MAPGMLASQIQKLFARNAQFTAVVVEVFVNQVEFEALQTGGDGRMRGKDVAGAGNLAGLRKAQALLVLQLTDAFQGEEGRMALIHVADRGAQAQRVQRADAADAHQDFLADARPSVAAIEAVGKVAVLRQMVLLDV